MAAITDVLPDDPGMLKAMLLAERARAARLAQIIKELQRHRFGRRAEKLPEDQLLLGLEEVEQTAASADEETDKADATAGTRRAAKRRLNRGALPAHLPRVEIVVDIDPQPCPCCQGTLHRIGEDVSERLDIVPAQLRVLVVRRPKYGCRACEEVVVQAPAPARLIEGGLPTDGAVAQVLVSKYADHLPLYRQAQIYARQSINLDRSTLADWVGRAAFTLRPVHERLRVLDATAETSEELPLEGFLERCADYFEDGCVIDQPFQARLSEGVVRCYMAGDRCAGFGHQKVKALVDDPAARSDAGPRLYTANTELRFQRLRGLMEGEWTPQLMSLLKIAPDELPVIWDADFMLGPQGPDGADTYVLGEINVSSVFPIPAEAAGEIARVTLERLNGRR